MLIGVCVFCSVYTFWGWKAKIFGDEFYLFKFRGWILIGISMSFSRSCLAVKFFFFFAQRIHGYRKKKKSLYTFTWKCNMVINRCDDALVGPDLLVPYVAWIHGTLLLFSFALKLKGDYSMKSVPVIYISNYPA